MSVRQERYQRMKLGWVRVDSIRVKDARYDLATRTLWVHFTNGVCWWYGDVHPNTARAFINSESKGKFINRILNRHPYGAGEDE